MKEYIERSAAVKAAQDGADEWDGGFNRNRDAYIEAAIDKVPTADVQEVRHSSCAKTLNGCRSHDGGQRDLYIIIERQREEIERLKNEISRLQAANAVLKFCGPVF